MKTLKHIIITLIVSLLPILSFASNKYIFRQFDAGRGLPDNNIRSVIMLPDGLLCIQTSTALSFFNGATFKNYRFDHQYIPYSEYTGLTDLIYDPQENILWCSSVNRIWAFNLDSKSFEYDIHDRLQSYGITDVNIDEIYIQSNGDFWAMDDDGSIWICDRKSHRNLRKHLPGVMHGPVAITEYKNNLWILSLDGRLTVYDTGLNDFKSVKTLGPRLSLDNSSRFEMDVTKNGELWMMYDRAIFSYNIESGSISMMNSLTLLENDLFTSISLDNDDNLWIGTARSGLSICHRGSGELERLPYLEITNGERIYPHTDISRIYSDDQGGMWLATQVEGLIYWNKSIIQLNNINSSTITSGKMPDESVKCMLEESDGSILLGTVKGLVRFDPINNSVTIPYKEFATEICISLFRDSNKRLWVGTFYNGVYCVDNGKVSHFYYPEMGSVDLSYQESKPNYNCVRGVMEDSNGNYWISVYGGIGRFDPESGKINLSRDDDNSLDKFMIVRDVEEVETDVAAACGDNGSYMFSLRDGSIIQKDFLGYGANEICNQIHVDKRGLMWLAEGDGLRIYDDKGLVDHIKCPSVMSISEDVMGNIWASSFTSIMRVRVDMESKGYVFSTTNYDKTDGVDAGTFFQNSSLVHSNGNIYFGGSHGLCVVDPNAMYLEDYGISPHISMFRVNGDERVFLPSKKIILKHDESSLAFSFTNLNYANPTLSSYKYKLEPLDREWQDVNSQSLGEARYSYLPAGEYVFSVISANNGTDWSTPTKLRISIKPPFYKSNLALALYVLLVLFALFGFVFGMLYREKKRNEEKNREEEHKRQVELDQMKFRFFTNISHELRTPLSLIMLPLDSLLSEEKDAAKSAKLETMRSNAGELLSLVNHLLDFRRIEMGGEKLQLAKGDIGEFIANVVAVFKDGMSKKGLGFEFENELTNPFMGYDSSKIQKIVNNLLSNAMKFTPAGGYVSVRLFNTQDNHVAIQVSDTGVGIKKDDIGRIFDRFFRSRENENVTGNGIGMSLVKQYVEMHNGNIEVQSEYGKGSVFTVTIPTDLKVDTQVDGVTAIVPNTESAAVSSKSDTKVSGNDVRVMVVDDNSDFRSYLSEELSKNYLVSLAEDGKQCLEMLPDMRPDIIVCDVMMPNMDGFEVTKAVKSNINTSHIPIILLTARTSDDFRLEGYETGADAYITKPFKMEILEARIKNLIEERQKRIASFSDQVDVSPMQMTITTIDQALMTKIMESIEKNMDNTDYSVEDLASDVGMHRMNLYRKIQSLTNMTPLEFIKTMRLKRAAQLIKNDPKLSVADVSLMVGFNTVKYFSKYFKEMFGVNPSQYANQ